MATRTLSRPARRLQGFNANLLSHGFASEAAEGRVTWVSGAAGGIGSAVARRLLAEGGRVVVADVNEAGGSSLAAELGDNALFVHCDVRSEESVRQSFEATAKHFGALHAAVCNAGIVGHNHALPLTEVTAEDMSNTIATNVTGVFYSIKHAARTMKAYGGEGAEKGTGGSIVTIASIGGMRGSPGIDTPYQVAKAAVIGLTQTAAAKLCRDGIRVNCVSPTGVETQMTAALQGMPDELAQLEKTLPIICPLLGRMVKPDELAGIISFLLSDTANNLTGINVPIDQGWSAGAIGGM